MLSDLQIDEVEVIFRIIDDGHLPDPVIIDFLDWLKTKDIERFASLNWMLLRWVCIRDHKYHLPKRFINLSKSV